MFRLLVPLIVLALVGVWVLTIASIIRTPEHAFRTGNQVVWLLVVLLVPLVGVPLYYVMGAPARRGA